jgi:hypothetical protein
MLKYLADPNFRAALRQAQSELLSELNRQLLLIGSAAINALGEVLAAPDSQAVAVRAADTVLGRLLQLRELGEIETRLRALEERIANEKS